MVGRLGRKAVCKWDSFYYYNDAPCVYKRPQTIMPVQHSYWNPRKAVFNAGKFPQRCCSDERIARPFIR